MVGNAHMQQAPSLDDVTADGCVHEAGKQGYAPKFGKCRFRVRPGVDGAGGLEQFQAKANGMKQGDGFHFVPGFKLGPQHAGLNRQRNQQEQIIAGDAADAPPGHDKQRHKE